MLEGRVARRFVQHDGAAILCGGQRRRSVRGQFGIDLERGFRRHYVLEVNAFGVKNLAALARDLGNLPLLHTST